jgi:hypothetical protein
MADQTAAGEPDDEQGATVVPLRKDGSVLSAEPDDPEYSTRVPDETSDDDPDD